MRNPEKSENGKTVDFLLPHQAGCRGRRGFFRRGFKSQGRLPRAITLVTRIRIGRRGKSSANIGQVW